MGVRIRLKGLNYKTRRLADGTLKTYYWAWRGGPSLPGKPGDPEFMAAYNQAIAKRTARPAAADTLLSVLNAYQASGKFEKLAPRTRQDYAKQIVRIEAEYRDFPIIGLTDPEAVHIFSKWRDKIAKEFRSTTSGLRLDGAFGCPDMGEEARVGPRQSL